MAGPPHDCQNIIISGHLAVILATDGWTVRDVQQAASVEPVPDLDASPILFDEGRIGDAAAQMLHCAYPLPCRPVLQAELAPQDEASDPHAAPVPSAEVPMPQPATHSASPDHIEHDATDAALVAPSDDDDQ